MAMGWLKGLVAPAFSGDQQQGQQIPGMQPGMQPPVGGMPPQGGSPYGAQMPPPGTPPIGAPGGPAPYDQSALPNAMQWSTGTRTQGAAQSGGGISGGGISGSAPQGISGGGMSGSAPQGISGGGISGSAPQGISGGGISGGAPQGAQSLEARCAQLEHDIQSMALFARTLLTMLEEGKIVTREQFDATKHRLDMLDGKLDDK